MRGEWLRRPQNGVAVIFLHGVLSSIETSWRHENGAFWPQLVIDAPSIQTCGVYLFAYRSTIFSGTYRLGDVVDALKEQMRLDDIFDCHTIIFVAHSMGGIVARKLIVSRAADFQDRNITLGLFLVASPSLGSHYANLLAPLARAMKHTQADALRFSQNNSWLMDLDREFTNLKESGALDMVGKELVEDQFVVLKGLIQRQVVSPISGAKYFGEAIKIPASDHSSIAKPESVEALQHRLLVRFVDQLVDGAALPIEFELKDRLQTSLDSCRTAGVPLRAFHKLMMLLSMRSEFSAQCFEETAQGLTGRITTWLRETIASQLKDEKGIPDFHTPIDDPHIAQAREIAKTEGAREINERHFLLALLGDRNSGTIAELHRSLGQARFEKLYSTAQQSRPKPLKLGRSNALKLGE